MPKYMVKVCYKSCTDYEAYFEVEAEDKGQAWEQALETDMDDLDSLMYRPGQTEPSDPEIVDVYLTEED